VPRRSIWGRSILQQLSHSRNNTRPALLLLIFFLALTIRAVTSGATTTRRSAYKVPTIVGSVAEQEAYQRSIFEQFQSRRHKGQRNGQHTTKRRRLGVLARRHRRHPNIFFFFFFANTATSEWSSMQHRAKRGCQPLINHSDSKERSLCAKPLRVVNVVVDDAATHLLLRTGNLNQQHSE